MATSTSTRWRTRRQRVFQSVFQTDISQPTPYSTPSARHAEQGQAFGEPLATSPSPFLDPSRVRSPATLAQTPPVKTARTSHTEATSPNNASTSRLAGQPQSPPRVYTSATYGHPPSMTRHETDGGLRARQDVDMSDDDVPSHAEDQVRYDRAWHVVTSRIALPQTVAAEDSFGTLPPESQDRVVDVPEATATAFVPASQQPSEQVGGFYDALRLVLHQKVLLPRATHPEDLVHWHTQQVRRHFAQHVLPMLSAIEETHGPRGPRLKATGLGIGEDVRHPGGADAEQVLWGSMRTLEAAMRLYLYGLHLICRGLDTDDGGVAGSADQMSPNLVASRFIRDIHALVSNSVSPFLMEALRSVVVRLTTSVLDIPSKSSRGPQYPPLRRPEDEVEKARQEMLELVSALDKVGLAGERFQVLFAEVMNRMMRTYIDNAYAGVWLSQEDRQDRQKELRLEAGSLADKLRQRRSDSDLPASVPNITNPSPVTGDLCDWVENNFARLAVEVFARVGDMQSELRSEGQGDERTPTESTIAYSDVEKWKEIAIGRLASLRMHELFDIVLAWPRSKGALDDLRNAVTTPMRRRQLTDIFSADLQRHLLHPGRSTLKILQTYISMIRTFHALDHSKVLLSRVVPSLQLYLCTREDAVRIVVTGLLSNPDDAQPGPKSILKKPDEPAALPRSSTQLVELAALLNDPRQNKTLRRPGPLGARPEDDELDWNDLEWVPDPVDAGVNYKRPRSEDVIGELIEALGSQDSFIKEFAGIVAERLLSRQPTFTQEVRVLNLLKKRFGEAALQNCDVMIRDIQDSRAVDRTITHRQQVGALARPPALREEAGGEWALRQEEEEKELELEKEPAQQQQLKDYHARILSRLFWPASAVEKSSAAVPPAVRAAQARYEGRYEELKSGRKLTWLPHMGQATVELELADRTLEVDCRAYEATVIHAFQKHPSSSSVAGPGGEEAVRRSADDLWAELQMDEDLLAAALDFWVAQRVLRRAGGGGSGGDVYVVIEDASEDAAAAAEAAARDSGTEASSDEDEGTAAAAAAAASPTRRAAPSAGDAREQERRAVYWQFVTGMLTNNPAMPLAQIAMMMKMLIAEGFGWTNEELGEFLGEKVAEGTLEVAGGKYRLVKK